MKPILAQSLFLSVVVGLAVPMLAPCPAGETPASSPSRKPPAVSASVAPAKRTGQVVFRLVKKTGRNEPACFEIFNGTRHSLKLSTYFGGDWLAGGEDNEYGVVPVVEGCDLWQNGRWHEQAPQRAMDLILWWYSLRPGGTIRFDHDLPLPKKLRDGTRIRFRTIDGLRSKPLTWHRAP